MPATSGIKSSYREMTESFDKLMYMIKTTAPHLQSYGVDLRSKMENLLKEGSSKPAPSAPSIQ